MRGTLVILGLLLLLAILGPLLAPYDPNTTLDSVPLRLLPPLVQVPALSSAEGAPIPIGGWDTSRPGVRVEDWRIEEGEVVYRRGPRDARRALEDLRVDAEGQPELRDLRFLAGTDRFGRDLFSRLLAGARISLAIGLGSVLVAAIIGVLIGMGAGLLGPAVDLLLTRLADATMAIPRIVLVMVIAALWRPDPYGLALLIGATGWPQIARLVRSEVKALSGSDLVASARAAGASRWRIAWRHLAPHVAIVLLVAAALRLGPFILLEASLSFLGFGIAPPEPSWGNILAEGREVLFEAWWVATLPGVLLGASVLLANVAADRAKRQLRGTA